MGFGLMSQELQSSHSQELTAQAKCTAAKCFYIWSSVCAACVLSNSSSIVVCTVLTSFLWCLSCSHYKCPTFSSLTPLKVRMHQGPKKIFQTGWDLLPELKADSCLSGRDSITTSPLGPKHSCVSWIFIVNIHPDFTLSVGGGASFPRCSS